MLLIVAPLSPSGFTGKSIPDSYWIKSNQIAASGMVLPHFID